MIRFNNHFKSFHSSKLEINPLRRYYFKGRMSTRHLPGQLVTIGQLVVSSDTQLRSFSVKAKRSKKVKGEPIGIITSIPRIFILILEEYARDIKLDYPISEIADQVIKLHNQLIKDNGIIPGTKRFNTIRLYVLRLLEGDKPENPPFMAVSKKYQFPSAVFKALCLYNNVLKNKCPKSDRILRSLFYLNRLVKDNNKMDLGYILKEFKVSTTFKKRFRDYLKFWIDEVKIEKDFDLVTEPLEKIVKAGPNGKSKWETADIEAVKLVTDPLWGPYKEFCELTGNQNLSLFIEKLSKDVVGENTTRLRYLTSIADSANKSRVVAISDYWTLVLLTPLMKSVQSIILRFFSDYTSLKSHEQGFLNLKRNIREGINSYDISSWTDAFPAELQKIVLEEIFSPELANSWYQLVVTCDWQVKGMPDSIKYATGQGMGTPGSFDIATLTDMLVLFFIYKEYYNVDLTKDQELAFFEKVGDDLWCYDPQLHIYNVYTKELGLEINLSKTKRASSSNNVGEYVSRNLNNGFDVSRISANICRAVKKNILDIPQLAKHLEERDVNVLPIREIIRESKHPDLEVLIRTLYLQSLIFPDWVGMKLLYKSLRKDYLDFISSDPIISLINKDNCDYIKYSFLIQSIKDTVVKIEVQLKNTFKAMPGLSYECSLDLVEDNTGRESFKYDIDPYAKNGIELITSKLLLAKSFQLLNQLFQIANPTSEVDQSDKAMVTTTKATQLQSNTLKLYQLENVFDQLNAILQGLTFKELGVISSTSKPYRPTTTALYNYVKGLRPIWFEPNLHPTTYRIRKKTIRGKRVPVLIKVKGNVWNVIHTVDKSSNLMEWGSNGKPRFSFADTNKIIPTVVEPTESNDNS